VQLVYGLDRCVGKALLLVDKCAVDVCEQQTDTIGGHGHLLGAVSR
jgi:hypothetical protein